MKKLSFLLVLLLLFTTIQINSQNTYIFCGKLIDTEKGSIKEKQTLIVNGIKITDVIDGYVTPNNKRSKTIDLKDKVVMPGLIDMHVHIEIAPKHD